jgi:NADPH:quinone reductase-like Zn-dependent oxidoreductase
MSHGRLNEHIILTMSSSQQKALILPNKQAEFIVGPVRIPIPGPGQLLIQVDAAGLNPVDWKVQQWGFSLASYPVVLGHEMSGTVEKVGEGVSDFREGDNV